MGERVVFCLLILCGLVLQGICTLSELNKTSSDLHIRKRRLVGPIVGLDAVPFLVNLNVNGVNHCPATLLTYKVALTSAACLNVPNARRWQIQYGSYYHELDDMITYGVYNPQYPTMNNLALIFLTQGINSRITRHRPIKIFTENLSSIHSDLHVYNWQHLNTRREVSVQSNSQVHMVTVRPINFNYCQNFYHHLIGPMNFCTQFTVPNQYCENGDTGAPAVVNNELVGIFVYRGNNHANPDVFMSLQEHGIKEWIQMHVPSLRLF